MSEYTKNKQAVLRPDFTQEELDEINETLAKYPEVIEVVRKGVVFPRIRYKYLKAITHMIYD